MDKWIIVKFSFVLAFYGSYKVVMQMISYEPPFEFCVWFDQDFILSKIK